MTKGQCRQKSNRNKNIGQQIFISYIYIYIYARWCCSLPCKNALPLPGVAHQRLKDNATRKATEIKILDSTFFISILLQQLHYPTKKYVSKNCDKSHTPCLHVRFMDQTLLSQVHYKDSCTVTPPNFFTTQHHISTMINFENISLSALY